jgi:hypothetical protein
MPQREFAEPDLLQNTRGSQRCSDSELCDVCLKRAANRADE